MYVHIYVEYNVNIYVHMSSFRKAFNFSLAGRLSTVSHHTYQTFGIRLARVEGRLLNPLSWGVLNKVMATALGRQLCSRTQWSLGQLNRPFRQRASSCVLGIVDFSTHVLESSNRKKSAKETYFAYPTETSCIPTTSTGQSPAAMSLIQFNVSPASSGILVEDDGG